MTTRKFEKINDIFNCKLILEDGSEFTIPLREDGYIYATGLCKAVGKRPKDWLRLRETKEFIIQVEKNLKKSDTHNSLTKNNNETQISLTKNEIESVPILIEIHQAGNKYNQGTWIHPDLGLNLAQWCSASFSIQVSKWMRELIFTGTVDIENEKKDEEIDNKFQELVKELEETKSKLSLTEELVKSYDNNILDISTKFQKLKINHQSYLRHKELYKLRRGPCVYLIDMKNEYNDEISRYKVGQTSDITNRVSGYRTANPFCRVMCVMYVHENLIIEKNMKIRYQKHLLPNNSEFITGVDIETLKDDLFKFASILNCEYTLETDEEINKFNRHIISVDDVLEEDEQLVVDGKKRCGGLHHDSEESRMVPLSEYFKNKSNRDGYARICKECYLIGVYGDKRKKRKVVTIPKFDTTKQKWCNLCESVKDHSDFYADNMKKDGLNANCKSCKAKQKQNQVARKKAEKENEKHDDASESSKTEEILNKNPYERYSKRELRQIAIDKGLKITYKFTKSELISILS
jgi:hypothetical protein